MLIGTAVVGATTMIFSIILLLGKAGLLHLSLTDAPVLLGFICGGAVVFWFCGASMQAVTTGAYRAVEFIKKNMDLTKKEADIEDSKTVVRICTQYAQSGMWNIFIALMTITLAFAFFDPNFFVAYLISIAVFGLFQAIYMANAGGAWDNAKKLVEVDLKEKGTPLHAATVVGDTVGDPFKDTTSVALNPIIKFSTLFGLLAVEIAVQIKQAAQHEHGHGLHRRTSASSCWRSRWCSCGGRSTRCAFRRRSKRLLPDMEAASLADVPDDQHAGERGTIKRYAPPVATQGEPGSGTFQACRCRLAFADATHVAGLLHTSAANLFYRNRRRPHRPARHAAAARRPVRPGHRLSLLQRLPRRQGRGPRRRAASRRPTASTTARTTTRPTSGCCSAITSPPSPGPGRSSARCWPSSTATCRACSGW